jgi:hypothetical protein
VLNLCGLLKINLFSYASLKPTSKGQQEELRFTMPTNDKFCEEFSRIMTKRFEMFMMGELKFFLGFQIK